eukprot:TRINITY_DN2226_c0_g1_i3.p1 TRINITY_DN2226_c0_g1~~TRINITY_DN2226_c0_g1_i3.p1  ORF type:complete len:177 (-),score=0.44 TRINITY_DN2226_c0_g1_i3:165-695(-)
MTSCSYKGGTKRLHTNSRAHTRTIFSQDINAHLPLLKKQFAYFEHRRTLRRSKGLSLYPCVCVCIYVDHSSSLLSAFQTAFTACLVLDLVRRSNGQLGLASGGLAQESTTVLAVDGDLGVGEDGVDSLAVGALDVHEIRVGGLNQSLELVGGLLSVVGGGSEVCFHFSFPQRGAGM